MEMSDHDMRSIRENSYSVKQFAQITKVSQRSVRRWIDKGYIKSYKLGGRWYIMSTQIQLVKEIESKGRQITCECGKKIYL